MPHEHPPKPKPSSIPTDQLILHTTSYLQRTVSTSLGTLSNSTTLSAQRQQIILAHLADTKKLLLKSLAILRLVLSQNSSKGQVIFQDLETRFGEAKSTQKLVFAVIQFLNLTAAGLNAKCAPKFDISTSIEVLRSSKVALPTWIESESGINNSGSLLTLKETKARRKAKMELQILELLTPKPNTHKQRPDLPPTSPLLPRPQVKIRIDDASFELLHSDFTATLVLHGNILQAIRFEISLQPTKLYAKVFNQIQRQYFKNLLNKMLAKGAAFEKISSVCMDLVEQLKNSVTRSKYGKLSAKYFNTIQFTNDESIMVKTWVDKVAFEDCDTLMQQLATSSRNKMEELYMALTKRYSDIFSFDEQNNILKVDFCEGYRIEISVNKFSGKFYLTSSYVLPSLEKLKRRLNDSITIKTRVLYLVADLQKLNIQLVENSIAKFFQGKEEVHFKDLRIEVGEFSVVFEILGAAEVKLVLEETVRVTVLRKGLDLKLMHAGLQLTKHWNEPISSKLEQLWSEIQDYLHQFRQNLLRERFPHLTLKEAQLGFAENGLRVKLKPEDDQSSSWLVRIWFDINKPFLEFIPAQTKNTRLFVEPECQKADETYRFSFVLDECDLLAPIGTDSSSSIHSPNSIQFTAHTPLLGSSNSPFPGFVNSPALEINSPYPSGSPFTNSIRGSPLSLENIQKIRIPKICLILANLNLLNEVEGTKKVSFFDIECDLGNFILIFDPTQLIPYRSVKPNGGMSHIWLDLAQNLMHNISYSKPAFLPRNQSIGDEFLSKVKAAIFLMKVSSNVEQVISELAIKQADVVSSPGRGKRLKLTKQVTHLQRPFFWVLYSLDLLKVEPITKDKGLFRVAIDAMSQQCVLSGRGHVWKEILPLLPATQPGAKKGRGKTILANPDRRVNISPEQLRENLEVIIDKIRNINQLN